MYKLLYPSIRVRTEPPISVRVRIRASVSFSFTFCALKLIMSNKCIEIVFRQTLTLTIFRHFSNFRNAMVAPFSAAKAPC